MNAFLRKFVERIFGTLIRHGFQTLGAWLVVSGSGALDPSTQENLVEVAIGGICVLISFGLSYARSHFQAKQVEQLHGVLKSFGITPPPPPASPVRLPMLLTLLCMVSLVSGCAVMSRFDQNTYVSATQLKTDSMALIAHTGEQSSDWIDHITALEQRLAAQVAYEEGKGKANTISAAQWRILISPDHELLGGFLKRWKAGDQMSPDYQTEKRVQIGEAFDELLRLEASKTK